MTVQRGELKAKLIIEVREDVVWTRLVENPAGMSYAELSKELAIASKHVSALPEGETWPHDDPHVEYITPGELEEL